VSEERIAPKMAELILHIAQRCAADPYFGAKKLNKLLYYSDFLAYARLGASITGQEYRRRAQGPEPRLLVAVRDQMVKSGELAIQDVELVFGNRQKRPVNLRAANLALFTAAEIALVDDVIHSLDKLSSREISQLSHREVGWRAAKDGDTIAYATIFLSDEPLNEAEQDRAVQLMQELQMSGRLPASFQELSSAS